MGQMTEAYIQNFSRAILLLEFANENHIGGILRDIGRLVENVTSISIRRRGEGGSF